VATSCARQDRSTSSQLKYSLAFRASQSESVSVMADRLSRASEMRHIRSKLGLSQTAFARLLGVSPESYRPWDSGRRRPQREWMDKARSLLALHNPARVLSMVQLADILGVHPRTLRDAARVGLKGAQIQIRFIYWTRSEGDGSHA
jgi:DNA-binding transcriptional regulator YiaG